jgi:hypothetical protein
MDNELILHIILEKPPVSVDYDLQKGSGNMYETIQKQRPAAGQDLRFNCPLLVKAGKDGAPDFRGPMVQGAPGERFIYIDIGAMAGQTGSAWSRRLKIPLSGITWEMVQQIQLHPDLALVTRVPGTGKDGGPNCATVKPFSGWQVQKH